MKQKSAEILCIGTELLMGNTVNTNATYIAKGLAQNGVNVFHQAVVGDNPQRLKESLDLVFHHLQQRKVHNRPIQFL